MAETWLFSLGMKAVWSSQMFTDKRPGLRYNRFDLSCIKQYFQWNPAYMDDLCIPQSSSLRRSNHDESKVESLWRRYESLSGVNSTLSRSISMDMLPQPDQVGTNSLRVLFESKNALRQDYASSPRLNVTPQAKSSPVSHITSPGREKGYSGATTVTNAKKDKAHQVCNSHVMFYFCLCLYDMDRHDSGKEHVLFTQSCH